MSHLGPFFGGPTHHDSAMIAEVCRLQGVAHVAGVVEWIRLPKSRVCAPAKCGPGIAPETPAASHSLHLVRHISLIELLSCSMRTAPTAAVFREPPPRYPHPHRPDRHCLAFGGLHSIRYTLLCMASSPCHRQVSVRVDLSILRQRYPWTSKIVSDPGSWFRARGVSFPNLYTPFPCHLDKFFSVLQDVLCLALIPRLPSSSEGENIISAVSWLSPHLMIPDGGTVCGPVTAAVESSG